MREYFCKDGHVNRTNFDILKNIRYYARDIIGSACSHFHTHNSNVYKWIKQKGKPTQHIPCKHITVCFCSYRKSSLVVRNGLDPRESTFEWTESGLSKPFECRCKAALTCTLECKPLLLEECTGRRSFTLLSLGHVSLSFLSSVVSKLQDFTELSQEH